MIEQPDCLNLQTGGMHYTASAESRRKRSEMMMGHKHSVETKQKMSNIHKGKVISTEHKQKLSDIFSSKHKGEGNPFFGKKHSEETKAKIRASMLKRKLENG